MGAVLLSSGVGRLVASSESAGNSSTRDALRPPEPPVPCARRILTDVGTWMSSIGFIGADTALNPVLCLPLFIIFYKNEVLYFIPCITCLIKHEEIESIK